MLPALDYSTHVAEEIMATIVPKGPMNSKAGIKMWVKVTIFGF